jgi:methionyl-tRNA synthetase
VLTSIMPETSDSEFTWKDYQARVNNELVAILGNFVNRVMILMHKYFEGKVLGGLKFTNQSLFNEIGVAYDGVETHLNDFKFRNAISTVMDVARLGNRYLTENEPWKTFKESPEEARDVLQNCLHIIAHLATLSQPFLPHTSKKIFGMLNMEKEVLNYDEEIVFADGHQLNPAALLFEKVEDVVVEAQVQKLADAKSANSIETKATVLPAKENISFDQFASLDIRVGTILAAEKVAKTKKLLKLKIDTGIDQRTVVSGIADYFDPEKIIGQQVSILVNLEPREIKGILSQGMILMAENSEGKLTFAAPKEEFTVGSVIR